MWRRYGDPPEKATRALNVRLFMAMLHTQVYFPPGTWSLTSS